MTNTSGTSGSWLDEQPKKVIKLPCENCGKLVMVVTPFIGCVYCGECSIGESYSVGAPEFIPRYG